MAVQPLHAPFDQRINSPNRRYYVLLSARDNRTAAYDDSTKTKLWEMSGWFRVAALCDDGEHLITGYDGVNLIPANYDPKMIMLTFYRRGNPFRSISLQELVPDLAKLQPTASHVYWGYYTGFENGLYRVDTVDRGTLRFDPKTGDLVQHKQANR
jgi:hypothetical protein